MPPPRDLRLGVYKFAAVPAGQLPRDADFVRTLRQGLHGTAMQAWQVPDAELDDLIQYVKSFAPRWRSETPGDEVTASPDPWLGREADAVARGVRVYHGLAQCAVACHPAYVTRAEIAAFTKELTGIELREIRPDVYQAVAKDSDYGVKILPPDFTFNALRGGDSARRHLPGHRFRHRRHRHADLEERPARARPVGAGALRPVAGRAARRPRGGCPGPAPARSAGVDTGAAARWSTGQPATSGARA